MKVKIQIDIASGSTGEDIIFMYTAVNKLNSIGRYMEALTLHTDEQPVYWEYNTTYIYAVEAKRVTPRVKHIDITV